MTDGTSLPIRIEQVSKKFGALTVLDDVSLSIKAGEFVTLLGPSGSGKTTLLNVLAGFVLPDAGKVSFAERDVTLEPPHKRNLGVVFQNYALFPHMDVAANVAFPLTARKYPKAEIGQRVARALELVQLDGYGGRRIDQLSGGQRQRVALARAIVFEPKIILMDEPLSALDKQLREAMQIELRAMHAKLGATTVYVTHDQREALTMSDRIVVLNRGRIVQVGSPRELYEHPADRFVAEFVGESSVLPVRRAGANAVDLGGQIIRSSRAVPEGEALLLVLRSEKLTVGGGADGANRLRGIVSDVVYQGESMLIFARLPDGSTVALRQVSRNDAAIPRLGEETLLSLDPEHAIVVAA